MAYQSLAEMFLSQARRYGNRILYRFARNGHWETYTWEETLRRVEEIALGLVALGVKKGDRVAIFSANRVEWSLIDWANICIGTLTVPIYSSSTPSQVCHILEHAECGVLLVDSFERLGKLAPDDSSLRQLKQIIVIDPAGGSVSPGLEHPRVLSLHDLQERGRRYGEEQRGALDRLASFLRPEDDLTIIYTSGTSGEPKGVLTTHGHYLFVIDAVDAALSSSEEDVTLQFLPFAHSFGRLEHFMVVAKGYTCGFARSLETIAKDLLVIRPTLLFSVPRIYENAYGRIRSRLAAGSALRRFLFRWAISVGSGVSRRRRDCAPIPWILRIAHALARALVFAKIQAGLGGKLRLAISGGAPLAQEIGEFFHSLDILILEGYGLTETSTVSHVNRQERYKFGTVGPALPGMECRIAPDGEILLRGPNVFKEYYRDAKGTREATDPEGWFHTGDIGEIDGEGFLRITDRKKDLIVTSGGKKVAPQMIENLLKTDPWISQAMVMGDRQSHLIALITLNQEQVRGWGEREGLEFHSPEEIASHPRVLALVKEKIRQKNKDLAAFEAVRSFRVLPRDLTVEREELTPTLKLRRQVVMERYKELVQEMVRRPRFDL
ncbi:MAG: long-chain fatty acid--CoA ligase [Deltaproteobacteria bacterium]|nr:long-chain fatty acid--CoA ligase [Deltaproteobacteria bacterium]